MRSKPRRKPVTQPDQTRGPALDQPEPSFVGRAVVVCLGNRYLKDDGFGIRLADSLKGELGEEVVVEAFQSIDLPLLSRYEGASKLIVVDALRTGSSPGTVSSYKLLPNGKPLQGLSGLHGLQLHDLFDVAWQSGLLRCPVSVVGVEPKDCGLGEGLTAVVEEAIPQAIAEVKAALLR